MLKSSLTSLTILICFISILSNGQSSISDNELVLQHELEILQSETLNHNLTSKKIITTQSKNSELLLITDLDDDGMDDEWELANGLDSNDPKDAWADNDNDDVLNLYEFQMESNPNDKSSPISINLSPSDADMLEDLIRSGEGGQVYIRMSEGTYDQNTLAVLRENFRIMIQGGWNADFTIYSPNEYATYWNGDGDEALNLLIPSSNDVVTESTIILDGINFNALDYFSLSGAASINITRGVSYVSINNCSMQNCTYYGLSVYHKNVATDANVFISNTLIGNNMSAGMYTQITGTANTRWRIFNSTMNNPNSENGGIDGLTSGDAKLNVELVNSIIWGNNGSPLNFSTFHDFKATTMNSNIDEFDTDLDITDLSNTINEDPLFNDVSNNDWGLQENSPCIDSGIDVGLDYKGNAPDMGAVETSDPTNTAHLKIENITTSPNPFVDQINIELNELTGKRVEIKITNMSGISVLKMDDIFTSKYKIDTSDLLSGHYVLTIESEDKQYFSRVVKI